MKFKLTLAVVALVALTSLAMGQPSDVTFSYYNASGEPALTSGGSCFSGTPIPDDAAQVEVWVDDSPDYMVGSFPINGEAQWVGAGYFWGLNYFTVPVDAYVYCVVDHEGCKYTSQIYGPIPGGSGSYNTIIACPSYPSSCEWSCNCGNPGCEVIEEYSSE